MHTVVIFNFIRSTQISNFIVVTITILHICLKISIKTSMHRISQPRNEVLGMERSKPVLNGKSQLTYAYMHVYDQNYTICHHDLEVLDLK